jgi:acyl dehydratase
VTASPPTRTLDGPWFEDLAVGDVFADAPGLTLTDGHAAVHQAIVGDRLKLALDAPLSQVVVGSQRMLAHPALVWDVAIGQSTTVTGRVIANLFYRGLAFQRAVMIGDTLRTRTEIAALRQTSRRPGTQPRGLALLHVTTRDQDERVVLDFHRCAMLPLRDPDRDTGAADEITDPAAALSDGDAEQLAVCTRGWRLEPLRAAAPAGGAFADLTPGVTWGADDGDVVSAAPELARLTVNIAAAHHDALRPAGDGRRLVYGGHTIALAAARISRALPTLATIPAWHRCDHVGPVFEGDTLYTEIEVQRVEPLRHGGGVAHLRARVAAAGEDRRRRDVLDWRLAAVVA